MKALSAILLFAVLCGCSLPRTAPPVAERSATPDGYRPELDITPSHPDPYSDEHAPGAILITIIGSVKAPARYYLKADSTLADAIFAAKGLIWLSDRRAKIVSKSKGTDAQRVQQIDFRKDLAITHSTPLHDGDLVFLTEICTAP